MKQYKELCQKILGHGDHRGDRTGTGTLSYFGLQTEYNLKEGFPLLTTKDMRRSFKAIVHELLWFLSGDTHIKYLVDNGVGIWNADAYRAYRNRGGSLNYKDFKDKLMTDQEFLEVNGDLGRIYGHQWRNWSTARIETSDTGGKHWEMGYVDQISQVVDQIKNNSNSRRLIVNAWNVGELEQMILPPCHLLFQFYVKNRELDCKLYQRSGDIFLGVPFNIASYALLTHMVAKVTGLKAGRLIHSFGDAHIYLNHVDQVREQLTREERPLPKLKIKDRGQSIFDFEFSDFELEGYDPHPPLYGEISVGK